MNADSRPTKTVVAERVKLLREAADDCECEGNTLLNDAPNMGPTKERRYREEAAQCVVRACALRAWADDMERQPSEPDAERDHQLAENVAAAASVLMVAWHADENCFDEFDALDAALKSWRVRRAGRECIAEHLSETKAGSES